MANVTVSLTQHEADTLRALLDVLTEEGFATLHSVWHIDIRAARRAQHKVRVAAAQSRFARKTGGN